MQVILGDHILYGSVNSQTQFLVHFHPNGITQTIFFPQESSYGQDGGFGEVYHFHRNHINELNVFYQIPDDYARLIAVSLFCHSHGELIHNEEVKNIRE